MLERKLKTALDESRLLILGAQVLFGFQFQSVFQDRFAELPATSRGVLGASLLLLLASIGLLIAPSLHHQIRYRGESNAAALQAATFFAGWSLLPLTLGLGLSTYVIFRFLFGTIVGIVIGSALSLIALLFLYGIGFALKRKKTEPPMSKAKSTPLETKIEQLLTEARVIIPGCQALLGFQFVAVLTKSFAELPAAAQVVHGAALCAVALAVTLLMTQAAVHRLAFGGEDSQEFFQLAEKLVIAATVPLAAGIAADVYVVFLRISASGLLAACIGFGSFLLLAALWLVYPYFARRTQPMQAVRGMPQQHGL
jgi:Family of unknown function (DUF6328)